MGVLLISVPVSRDFCLFHCLQFHQHQEHWQPQDEQHSLREEKTGQGLIPQLWEYFLSQHLSFPICKVGLWGCFSWAVVRTKHKEVQRCTVGVLVPSSLRPRTCLISTGSSQAGSAHVSNTKSSRSPECVLPRARFLFPFQCRCFLRCLTQWHLRLGTCQFWEE